MGKLVFFVALCILVWWLFAKGPLANQPPAPTPTPTQVAAAPAAPAPSPFVATPSTATPLPPLRPVFERACKENQVDLMEYTEITPMTVGFTGRSRRPTGVGDVLDTLRRQGVLRDIQNGATNPRNGKTNWQFMEHDVLMYYNYSKVTVYR